jgi:hypothetical protein
MSCLSLSLGTGRNESQNDVSAITPSVLTGNNINCYYNYYAEHISLITCIVLSGWHYVSVKVDHEKEKSVGSKTTLTYTMHQTESYESIVIESRKKRWENGI